MSRPIDLLIDRADAILSGEAETLEDWRDALELYQQAASMGSGVAFARIGDFYLDGKYAKRSVDKSIQNYKKSAEMGIPDGYLGLVQAYQTLGDDRSAFKIYKLFSQLLHNKEHIEVSDISSYIAMYTTLLKSFEKTLLPEEQGFLYSELPTALVFSIKFIDLNIGQPYHNSILFLPKQILDFSKRFYNLPNVLLEKMADLEINIRRYESSMKR